MVRRLRWVCPVAQSGWVQGWAELEVALFQIYMGFVLWGVRWWRVECGDGILVGDKRGGWGKIGFESGVILEIELNAWAELMR
jgi:hypothetical protein